MNSDEDKITAEAVEGATKGGLLASAASITSGLAVATAPVKLLGVLTIGTTAAISWPIVVAIGIAGAIFGGISAATAEGNRQERIRKEFTELIR